MSAADLMARSISHTQSRESEVEPRWYALWTHSHCEQMVHHQLVAKGFDVFAPTVMAWSRRGGVRRLIPVPMFPGYAFLRHAVDKFSYVEIVKTRGVVGILGERWDRLTPLADLEVDAIQRIVRVGLLTMPHQYLEAGQLVRITAGPLAGIEGIMIHGKPAKGLLVLSVELLRSSIAVEIDCTHVEPVTGPSQTRLSSTQGARSYVGHE